MKLSTIVLNVEDLEHVKAWYVQVFEMAIVAQGRDSFVLAGRDGGAALEIRRGRPLDHPERVTLAFHVDDVKIFFKRQSDGKIPFLSGPKKGEHGRLVVRLKDPAGHTVEVFTVEGTAGRA